MPKKKTFTMQEHVISLIKSSDKATNGLFSILVFLKCCRRHMVYAYLHSSAAWTWSRQCFQKRTGGICILSPSLACLFYFPSYISLPAHLHHRHHLLPARSTTGKNAAPHIDKIYLSLSAASSLWGKIMCWHSSTFSVILFQYSEKIIEP